MIHEILVGVHVKNISANFARMKTRCIWPIRSQEYMLVINAHRKIESATAYIRKIYRIISEF